MSTTVAGLWTKKDLTEAHRLAEACEANGAHWEFADWLLKKEPVAESGAGWNGSHARLRALGNELGLSLQTLRKIRRTAYAWPVEHRVPAASFAAHGKLASGGPETAAARAAELAARPRNRYGRVRTTTHNHCTLNCDAGTYAAIVEEAGATGHSISATATELITEALEARRWVASEAA